MHKIKTLKDYKDLKNKKGIIWAGSELPKRVTDKTSFKCPKGHIFEATYHHVRRGSGCPICCKNSRLSKDSFRLLAKEKNLKWVETEKTPLSSDKVKWICVKDHNFLSSYTNIKNGNRCVFCYGNPKKAKEDYIDLFSKNGFKIADFPNKYNNKTKLEVFCTKGHKTTKSYNDLQNKNSGCPFCSGNNKKCLNDYINLANKNGFKCLHKGLIKNTKNKVKWSCCTCGSIFLDSYNNIFSYPSCNKCSLSNRSKPQLELFDFLDKLIKCESNRRFYVEGNYKYELDVYIPEFKLGIEFNGLYWHSEDKKGKNYHIDKTNFFKEKGIEVIHIFENEWFFKKDIVKSILLNKINKSKVLYARKCTIKELSNIETNLFLLQNHIQGLTFSNKRLGLFLGDELVSVMTFGKSRFKKGEIELIRFCNKLNTSVVGGFSKLLKYAISVYNYENIVSYCNLRYFNGNGYLNCGFEEISISKPNYFYFKPGSLDIFNRMVFQKHKLPKLLDNFDSSLTEYQNMLNNGYLRIFDCGNLKLKFKC